MIDTSSLYETCQELFADYPLAARAEDPDATIHSMVLMVRDRHDPHFFVLMRDDDHGKSSYSLCPWPDGPAEDIEADGATVSQAAVTALTAGLPIPRHGSLFGWVRADAYTALVAVYAEYASPGQLPSWSVMPFVDGPEAQWPPFTGERLLGDWFWEQYRIGMIVSLENLVAEHPDTVFWVDSRSSIGSDCCVVAHDISGLHGATLRRGRYVYHRLLRDGHPVPPLEILLADVGKTDLAERFQRSGNGDPLAARRGA
jgi:hypothetical protein